MTDAMPGHVERVRLMLREMTVTVSLLHAQANTHLEPIGQNLTRWQALHAYATETATVSAVARSMNQSRQYLQRITDELAEGDYVTPTRNAAHRRSPLFAVTDSGRSLLAEMEAGVSAWTDHLAEVLPDSELEQFRATLEHLRAAVAGFEDRAQ